MTPKSKTIFHLLQTILIYFLKFLFLKLILLFLLFFPKLTLAENPGIHFSNECCKGKSITIAAVGDILLHYPLQIKGLNLGFESLWEEVRFYIQHADITYANLEGPMAYQIDERGCITSKKNDRLGVVYTGYPLFNYPCQLGKALKQSGFNIVSTANNHALDRSSIGIDRTLDELKKSGIESVGTRSKNSSSSWINIQIIKGIKIAFISCTEHTNGIDDSYHQVLHCYKKKDHDFILNSIQKMKYTVDAIIVLPHWGEEYEINPNKRQIYFAHRVLNAGATAVIGSHPHVLQPLQKFITLDGRETIIMYSLGNFVSYQGSVIKRTAVILLLGLTKTFEGTFINGVRFVPIYTNNRDGWRNIQIKMIPKDDQSSYSKIISQVLPMENALFSRSLLTNPQCYLGSEQ